MMVIDKGKLIALLVEKTSSPKEEIEQQLNELFTRIREAAQSNRQFHIDDFGTFSMLDGSLHFEPTPQLKTEINQKYAGMKPIELMEAFKETGAGIPVEEQNNTVDAPQPSPEEQGHEEEPPLKETETVDEQSPDQLDEVPEDDEKKETEAPPVPVSDEETETDEVSSEPVSGQTEGTTQKTKYAKERVSFRYGEKRNKQSKVGTILLFAFIVIAILLGGWMLYDSGVIGPADDGYESNPSDENAIQTVPPGGAADTTDDSTTVDSLEQNPSDSVSQNSPSGTGAVSMEYGLKGSFNDRAENAYTIVIHSFRLKTTVQEIADSLNQEHYRTVLMEGSVDDGTRWRLGLGQFQTITDAQKAVQTLPLPYKEDHFITRIR